MIIEVRDLVHPQQLGSGVLIGHQGANNTRLSSRGMRQSSYLIQQSYLDLICPYTNELGRVGRGLHLPEPNKGHTIVEPSLRIPQDYMLCHHGCFKISQGMLHYMNLPLSRFT